MMQTPEGHSPHERDEAEVHSWFQALEPRQPFSPSPQFRDKVFAGIEQQRVYQGWWARLTVWYASLEVNLGTRVAFAIILLMALGVGTWWGVQEFGHDPPNHRRIALRRQGDPAVLWPTYQFQQKLQRVAAPGPLVSNNAVLETSHDAYGFAPLPARTLFFRLGMDYAHALALLQSDDRVRAAQHVDQLVEALQRVQAPAELSTYLHTMHAMLQHQQADSMALAQVLAAFEPLYTATYNKADSTEGLTYFQVGTWVVNLSLAAAVGDRAALRQGQVIEALQHTLAQHGAAPVVLDTMAQLHTLVMQPSLTDHEVRRVHTLVQDLQRIMRD